MKCASIWVTPLQTGLELSVFAIRNKQILPLLPVQILSILQRLQPHM